MASRLQRTATYKYAQRYVAPDALGSKTSVGPHGGTLQRLATTFFRRPACPRKPLVQTANRGRRRAQIGSHRPRQETADWHTYFVGPPVWVGHVGGHLVRHRGRLQHKIGRQRFSAATHLKVDCDGSRRGTIVGGISPLHRYKWCSLSYLPPELSPPLSASPASHSSPRSVSTIPSPQVGMVQSARHERMVW